MARLIVKSPYIKCGGGQGAGGYMKYIATRERVEILPDDRPPTRKQEQFITKLVKDFPDTKNLLEYEDYTSCPTKANASSLITLALEENWPQVQSSEGYARYIATRPRTERLGDHGLFGDEDGVNLDKAMSELEHYTGNVWTHIISLHREDAERLGYDNAQAWRSLLRTHRNDIAAAMKIPPQDFRWYAAFHDEGKHVTCRMALDKAVVERLILKNPAANCKAPATHLREMAVLTGEEIRRLLIQAKEDGCYELLLLELSTGLRRGEILALQWDDLDFRTGALRVERQVQRIKGELVVSQPKTRTSIRSVILSGPILNVLEHCRKSCTSCWMFPSPKKVDSPLDPAAVRKKLTSVLKRAECKHLRFHDLRHTFATNALEHGMDIKTLSAIIGHVSSATTLNVYAHVTDEMRQKATDRIDRGIAGVEPPTKTECKKKPAAIPFQAVKGKYRKPGTGCITKISDHLWEGRYSPKVNGKRIARNVYAATEEECERRLAELIKEMKKELEPFRAKKKAG